MTHSIDPVSIGNLALSHLGTRSTIETLDEDTPEAQQVSIWFNISLDQALATANWNFARKRINLAAHADAPSGTWLFRYIYPSDCIVARYIVNPIGDDEDLPPFKVETSDDGTTKTILTDISAATLVYTFHQTFAVLYSAFFVEMLSYLLAHHMAMSITGRKADREAMLQTYLQFSFQAPAMDANEGIERAPREAESIRGR